jgi:four helix bundle protein
LEGLRIFGLAERVADEIGDEVITWTPFARETVGKELVRSADSIGANIAEGHGRFHYREEMAFDYYGRGSLSETRFWLRRAVVRRLMVDTTVQRLTAALDQLEPQLNAYINSLGARAASTTKKKRYGLECGGRLSAILSIGKEYIPAD